MYVKILGGFEEMGGILRKAKGNGASSIVASGLARR
jgi:hypothetical protein